MQTISKAVASILGGVLLAAAAGPFTISAEAASTNNVPLLTTTVSPSDYGINVFSYDSQMNDPSTITGMNNLGLGMQQFPNDNEWSWTTNSFRNGGTGAVSLSDWGNILRETNNQGLFIFDYDENPSFTGGGTPQDATQLTEYIVSNNLPIDAIVIGSEEYGAWDYSANMNPSFSANYYAIQTAQIAQAIHAVDPSMKVGVSFDLGQQPEDLNWDQTVLRVDGPYINFVSIHDYPNATQLSDSQLLSVLPNEIHEALSFVQNEITSNVPSRYASGIQTWVTEYNPYSEPGSQSTQAVYGAAMVESAMLWKVYGASKIFVWSYDGQAHSSSASWPVDTTAGTNYGLFALAGDGEAPELPANHLYPSGQALEEYMQAIGSGGALSVVVTSQDVVGQVTSSSGGSRVFAINTSNSAQSIRLQNSTVNVPAASMQVSSDAMSLASLSAQTTVDGASTSSAIQGNSVNYQSTAPSITQALSGYPGQSVTVTGTGFELRGKDSSVNISQNGVNYGGAADAYGVTITNWSNNSITFIVPDGSSGPALAQGSATVQIETSNQLVSNTQDLTVGALPTLSATVSGTMTPGSTITIHGNGFGVAPGQGYVVVSENGINYGGPNDSYKVAISSWTNDAISLQLPDGESGPPLSSGTATLQVMTSSGISSGPLLLTISAAPELEASLVSANNTVQPGQTIQISGSNFGGQQDQGYVVVSQNGVNYGAPGDWYGVTVNSWSNTTISLVIPQAGMSSTGHGEPGLAPGGATITVVTDSGMHSTPIQISVGQ